MTTENRQKNPPLNPFTNHSLPLGLRLYLAGTRAMFKLLGGIAPGVAGKLALRFFMTPPHFPTPRREQALRDAAQTRFQDISGRRIAIRSWGHGPVVLLSHGWGGRGSQFFSFIQPLVDSGFRVVAFDAPAHGDSSGKRTNMLDVSGVVAAVAEQEGPIYALIGHSFGCGTSLLAIDRLGVAPEKLVLIACFADILWTVRQFGAAYALNEASLAAMRDEGEKRYGNAYGQPWRWPELSPDNTIKSVTGDILLIHDHDDHEVPWSHAEQLKQIAPRAELFGTKRLGHRKILMSKKAVAECVRFLNEHSSRLGQHHQRI